MGALVPVMAVLSIGFLAEHVYAETPRFFRQPHSQAMQGFVQRGPHYRAVIAEAEAHITPGAVLIPWNDFLGYKSWTYSKRIGFDIVMSRPFTNLFSKHQIGALKTYVDQCGFSFASRADIYL